MLLPLTTVVLDINQLLLFRWRLLVRFCSLGPVSIMKTGVLTSSTLRRASMFMISLSTMLLV